MTTKEELIEKIKPFVYCYSGSEMLTNQYNDKVASKFAEDIYKMAQNHFSGFSKFDMKGAFEAGENLVDNSWSISEGYITESLYKLDYSNFEEWLKNNFK